MNMSAFNWFSTEKKAFDLRNVELTTASGNITYTARTGRVADNFVIDRVIEVTTTSTYDMTISVPDGVYAGQQLLIVMVAEGGTDVVNTSVDTGDNITEISTAGAWGILLWIDDTNGWVEMAQGT